MQLPPKLMFGLSGWLRKICSLCEDRKPLVISSKDFRFALEDRFVSILFDFEFGLIKSF